MDWHYYEWLFWREMARQTFNPPSLRIAYEQKMMEANIRFFAS